MDCDLYFSTTRFIEFALLFLSCFGVALLALLWLGLSWVVVPQFHSCISQHRFLFFRCIALLALGCSSAAAAASASEEATAMPRDEDIYEDIDDDEDKRPAWSNPFALSLLGDLYMHENHFQGFIDAARCFSLLQRYDTIRVKSWARKEAVAKLAAQSAGVVESAV